MPFPGAPGRGEMLPEGAVGHLVKPIERRALVKAVRKAWRSATPPPAGAEGIKRTDECAVLVVDDDPAMQRFVVLAFKSAQQAGEDSNTYRLIPATTGAEALTAARQHPPDVILLDLILPDCSGLDVLAVLQERGSHAPVILITAYDLPQTQAADASRPILELHMRRPLTREELAQALKGLLAAIRPAAPPATAAPTPPTDRAS
jgi:CheY-like chemotaxis protein